jgi:DNA-binding MarR family transcriptional regulator
MENSKRRIAQPEKRIASKRPAVEDCLEMSRHCLSSNLRKTERLVTRLYDSYLAKAGVTAAQLPILAMIHSLPSASFRELSERLVLERSTLSRNLAVLQRDGLVDLGKPSGPIPGRISVTARGRRILERAHRQWILAHETVASLLSPNSLAHTLRVLETLRLRLKTPPEANR